MNVDVIGPMIVAVHVNVTANVGVADAVDDRVAQQSAVKLRPVLVAIEQGRALSTASRRSCASRTAGPHHLTSAVPAEARHSHLEVHRSGASIAHGVGHPHGDVPVHVHGHDHGLDHDHGDAHAHDHGVSL